MTQPQNPATPTPATQTPELWPQVPNDPRVKVAHLVMALIFLGLAGTWALVAGGIIDTDRLALAGPAVLIAAGVVGLAASLASARNRRQSATTPHREQEIR